MENSQDILKTLISVASPKKTIQEFLTVFKAAVEQLNKLKNANQAEIAMLRNEVEIAFNTLKNTSEVDFKGLEGQITDTLKGLSKENADALNFMRDWVRNLPVAKNGEDGLPGKDAPQLAEIVSAVVQTLPPDVEETAEEIRNKLENLTGEERLDASAIKNLPKATGNVERIIEGRGPLWGLSDVDMSGILIGQSIKWDGVRWIPYTPSAGGNTVVYNEIVSGSATTFTLAHTPASGTLRLYANGQRLQPTTDYSLAGAIITTVLSWDTGTLTADYEY